MLSLTGGRFAHLSLSLFGVARVFRSHWITGTHACPGLILALDDFLRCSRLFSPAELGVVGLVYRSAILGLTRGVRVLSCLPNARVVFPPWTSFGPHLGWELILVFIFLAMLRCPTDIFVVFLCISLGFTLAFDGT